jgi:hypothetical protein
MAEEFAPMFVVRVAGGTRARGLMLWFGFTVGHSPVKRALDWIKAKVVSLRKKPAK